MPARILMPKISVPTTSVPSIPSLRALMSWIPGLDARLRAPRLLGLLLLASPCLLAIPYLLVSPCRAQAQGAVQGMALTRPSTLAAAPHPDALPAPARPLPTRPEAVPPAGRLPGQLTGRMHERIVRDICIGCDAR